MLHKLYYRLDRTFYIDRKNNDTADKAVYYNKIINSHVTIVKKFIKEENKWDIFE